MVNLQLLEHVFPTSTIPWDYDIYLIMVANEEVGRLVYRQGKLADLMECGHIGYGIDTPYRHHGYAYQACLELFKIIQVKEVIITCDEDNIASIKTIEKLNVLEKRLCEQPSNKEYTKPLWIYRVGVRQ